MRNVASKHLQNDDVEDLRIIETNKWGSMPILNLMDKEGYKNEEEIEPEVNDDEGLQEVAGKLEIRVVPKELFNKNSPPRPQTLSPTKPMQNGDADHQQGNHCTSEAQEVPQKPKIERTKSILKQSSKEKESVELSSPKRENISFAPANVRSAVESDKESINACDNKDVDEEIQCDIKKNECAQMVVSTGTEAVDLGSKTIDKQIGTEIMKKKVETESSSTETDQKLSRQRSQQDSLERNRKKLHRKSSLVVEQSESPSKNTSQRTVISKSIEAVKNNTVDSKSESSSSTHQRIHMKNGEDKDEPGGGGINVVDNVEMQERVMCSPGIDLGSNPNVTFVSNTSIPELGEKRSLANGISPGMDEQSEYFDATENSAIKDKRQEQDDEDSGVDNASQILRESSTSPANEGGRLSKIPVAVSGQRLAKCMSWSGDLTPGLRRRRQTEKYVTDPSQLKLRFKRHSSSGLRMRGISSCLIDAPESSPESSEGPPPPPPTGEPPSESQVRCRRFRPVT